MEVCIKHHTIVNPCAVVQIIEQLSGEGVHVMTSLHEEDVVHELKVFIELAVSLDLGQEYVPSDALTH